MKKEKLVQLWGTEKFRSFLYRKKAKDTSKPLYKIMDSLIEEEEYGKKKKQPLFPKW